MVVTLRSTIENCLVEFWYPDIFPHKFGVYKSFQIQLQNIDMLI